ncbi:MAG TPA: hypothetical protein VJR89_00870 [Polyangiales bacterium]|nr:hypothetical protein [Polyangiales bacterium]
MPTSSRAAPASAVVALAASAFMASGSRDFCLDDAWIHLAYAQSLKLGDGFSYNPGDHATGFSSPLWAALLALWPWFGNPVIAVKVLGALCHAALAWGAAALTLQLTAAERARPASFVAGLLVACDPLLVFSATSGMEVSLTAALCVWALWISLARPAAVSGAVALGAAAVFARPESLFLLAAFAVLAWSATRRSSAFYPFAGAVAALAVWVVYCYWVSGYPWPNTYYAKRHADLGEGLVYFGLRVLTAQAWSLALTGLVLVGLAVRRPGPTRTVALAWLTAVIGVAASRELLLNALFYCSRYFAIFAAIPCVLVASQLPERKLLRALVLVPIVAVNLFMLPGVRALQRAQENDITTLHTEPAQYAAATLPKDARVIVEGAGATRFFLPRSARVIDLIGLNYTPAVHARTHEEKLCSVLRARPNFLLLPDGFVATYQRASELEILRTFVDRDYALTVMKRRRPFGIVAAKLGPLRPQARALCSL